MWLIVSCGVLLPVENPVNSLLSMENTLKCKAIQWEGQKSYSAIWPHSLCHVSGFHVWMCFGPAADVIGELRRSKIGTTRASIRDVSVDIRFD